MFTSDAYFMHICCLFYHNTVPILFYIWCLSSLHMVPIIFTYGAYYVSHLIVPVMFKGVDFRLRDRRHSVRGTAIFAESNAKANTACQTVPVYNIVLWKISVVGWGPEPSPRPATCSRAYWSGQRVRYVCFQCTSRRRWTRQTTAGIPVSAAASTVDRKSVV